MLPIITRCQAAANRWNPAGRISCDSCAAFRDDYCTEGFVPGPAGACLRWQPDSSTTYRQIPFPCQQTEAELADPELWLWGFNDCRGCNRCPA